MRPPYTKLAIVIPTRNRAELAASAIRSVLTGDYDHVSVLVSDNSTVDEEVRRLATFCRDLDDRRVCYAKPAKPLSMVDNWEWALQQALQLSGVSHVLYLTDRFVFKPHKLESLLQITARVPDRVISYNYDTVNDCKQPVTLEQVSWSGSLFELKSRDLLRASAELEWQFYDCLPRMLNCIVPRVVLGEISKRYGNVFLSVAPDLCFAYRFLERFDSYFYYDKALLVQHALSRSHGYSQGHGKITDEYVDFLSNLKSTSINDAAPIAGINTNMNTVIHEYCVARQQSGSPKFHEINRANYFHHLAAEIRGFEDPELKQHMAALLEAHRSDFGSAPRTHVRKWAGVPAEVIQFQDSATAINYALSRPRARNWSQSNEEGHVQARLPFRTQESLLVYVRFLYVRVSVYIRPVLDPVRVLYDRYVGWRFMHNEKQ